MGLAIKNNIMASNAARHLSKSFGALATSVERLASGLRINSAKDDAAGLAVRELMRADIAVLQQGARNAQDGISMIQTMEGAMAVIDENLIRMKELAEQAATGSYSSAQRTIMDAEFGEMAAEIERIADNTKFNNITMLNKDLVTGVGATTDDNIVKIHVGTTATIDVDKVNMTQRGLDIETGDGGWEVKSGTDRGADSTSDVWLTITGTSTGGLTGAELTITFEDNDTAANDEDTITVAITTTTTGADEFSLANIVAQINNASQALGWAADGTNLAYDAAATYLDTASSRYVLKISSRDSTSDEYTINLHTATLAAESFTASGAFTVQAACAGALGSGDISDGGTASGFAAGVTGSGLNILTVGAAESALLRIETAINTKDTARASFGYKMNRLESTIAILDIQAENLMAAESRISDVDVSTEMAALTRNQVLSQAGIAMLAQANSMPQMALTLLR